MQKFTVDEVKRVVRILMNANTPMYLLRRMREEQLVRGFARETSADEIRMLIEAGVRDMTCVEHLAEVYAFVAAVSLKSASEIGGILDGLDLAPLKWGDFLKSAVAQGCVPTRILDISCLTKPAKPVREDSLVSVSKTVSSQRNLSSNMGVAT